MVHPLGLGGARIGASASASWGLGLRGPDTDVLELVLHDELHRLSECGPENDGAPIAEALHCPTRPKRTYETHKKGHP